MIEKDRLVAQAKASGTKIHLGDLLVICSIKHAESEALAKYKGRICFRGDQVKDEYGAVAVFQELSASPAAIQSANCNLAYGLLPGHSSSTADAIRAYVQSFFKSERLTS